MRKALIAVISAALVKGFIIPDKMRIGYVNG
jgi:hypothetical protein